MILDWQSPYPCQKVLVRDLRIFESNYQRKDDTSTNKNLVTNYKWMKMKVGNKDAYYECIIVTFIILWITFYLLYIMRNAFQ